MKGGDVCLLHIVAPNMKFVITPSNFINYLNLEPTKHLKFSFTLKSKLKYKKPQNVNSQNFLRQPFQNLS